MAVASTSRRRSAARHGLLCRPQHSPDGLRAGNVILAAAAASAGAPGPGCPATKRAVRPCSSHEHGLTGRRGSTGRRRLGGVHAAAAGSLLVSPRRRSSTPRSRCSSDFGARLRRCRRRRLRWRRSSQKPGRAAHHRVAGAAGGSAARARRSWACGRRDTISAAAAMVPSSRSTESN